MYSHTFDEAFFEAWPLPVRIAAEALNLTSKERMFALVIVPKDS